MRVAVTTSTRLLDDLLASLIGGPGLSLCRDGTPPPLVSVVTTDRGSAARGRVAIVLADRIDDPIQVFVDGRPALSTVLGPDGLRELILDIAQQLGHRRPPPITLHLPGPGGAAHLT